MAHGRTDPETFFRTHSAAFHGAHGRANPGANAGTEPRANLFAVSDEHAVSDVPSHAGTDANADFEPHGRADVIADAISNVRTYDAPVIGANIITNELADA